MTNHEETAKRLLPCNANCHWNVGVPIFSHDRECPHSYRPAVAAKLAEVERLKDGYQQGRFSSATCPGCEYKEGVFIKHCRLHADLAEAQVWK